MKSILEKLGESEVMPKPPIWDYRLFGPMAADDPCIVSFWIMKKRGDPWTIYDLDFSGLTVVVTKKVEPKSRMRGKR